MTLQGMLTILICIFVTPTHANWVGSWYANNSDAIVGLSTDPINPHSAKNTLIVIAYSKKFDCEPIVSVIVIKGQSMGQPIKQQTFKSKKNQLVITVAQREYRSETRMTEYTTAIELAAHASNSLIAALSNPESSFSARIGNTTLLSFEKASNFIIANQLAKANCK